jgi:hypothetical protein
MLPRNYAKPKAVILGGGAGLDYVRKETAPGLRCMRANLGRGAQMPSQEVSGVDATEHHILGGVPKTEGAG